MTKSLPEVLCEVGEEVARAEAYWPPMNSAHEAYVFTNQKKRDIDAMRKEAIQVAAMAVRFVRDICDGGRGRK